jgi:hypothetical protein
MEQINPQLIGFCQDKINKETFTIIWIKFSFTREDEAELFLEANTV